MNNIKELFNKKINKDDIKNNIIKKINNRKIVYKIYKPILVSCFIFLMIELSIVTTIPNKEKNTNFINTSTSKERNNEEFLKYGSNDIGWNYLSKSLDEFKKDYPFLKYLNVNNYELTKSEIIYEYDSNEYIGNILLYRNEESYISIFFSEKYNQMPREYRYNDIDLDTKIILNKEVKMIEKENHFITFFKIEDYNIDIEAENMDKESYMMVIELILKGE